MAGARPKRMPVASDTSAAKDRMRAVEAQVHGFRLDEWWTVRPEQGPSPNTPRPARRSPPSSCEQHALGEELPDQPPAAGADREAHRNLLASRMGARQQKIGHVATRDQQDQRDDRQPDRCSRASSCCRKSRREHAPAATGSSPNVRPRLSVGKLALERLADGIRVGARLFQCHAILQARDRLLGHQAPPRELVPLEPQARSAPRGTSPSVPRRSGPPTGNVPRKPSPVTPITVKGWPLRVMPCPTTSGRPPNRRCQRP